MGGIVSSAKYKQHEAKKIKRKSKRDEDSGVLLDPQAPSVDVSQRTLKGSLFSMTGLGSEE